MNSQEVRLPEDHEMRNRAATDFDTTLLVEAAAGTGKTTLLVSRILNIVRSGRARFSDIAAITFTEKAAGDLKVRLREEIEKQLRQGAAPELARGLADLESMPVSTIHSFCAELVRERPVEAGVEPNFSVADELAAGLLLEESWEEWLAEALSSDDPRLRAALEAGIKPGPGEGQSMFSLARTLIDYRDCIAENPVPDPRNSDGLAKAVAELRRSIQDAMELRAKHCTAANDKLAEALQSLSDWAEKPVEMTAAAIEKWVDGGPSPRWKVGRKSNWSSEEILAEAQQSCLAIKNAIGGLRVHSGHAILHGLVGALLPFVERYRQAKREARLLDFDDLLIVARDMLLASREARDYFKRRFKFLLVDEFQDTNPLQSEIAFLLCERQGEFARNWHEVRLHPGKLFLVGDPKQSIYRFRRADLDLYGRVRELVEAQGATLQLSVNFRTVPAVVRELNPLFGPLMQGPVDRSGVTRFEPCHVELKPFRQDDTLEPRVLIVPPPEGTEADRVDAWRRQESGCIAASIRNLMDSGSQLQDDQPLRYSDIAILYGKGLVLGALEDALRAHDVPYQVAGGKNYYSRLEFQDLLAVLAAIDNPHDGPAVVGALRSPFFGCSDSELAAHVGAGGAFNYLASARPASAGVAMGFDILRELHEERHAQSPDAVISSLFRVTQALQIYAMKPHGEQRVANLLKVVDLARGLREAGVSSFSGVVKRLAEMEQIGQGEGESPIAEAREDFVRLITYHKSKGLEFPVVFMAFLGDGSKSPESVLMDSNGQLQLKVGGLQTEGFDDALLDEKDRGEFEDRRLFYVGATRARDMLIIPAYWTSERKSEEEEGQGEPYMLNYLSARYPRNDRECWGHCFKDASGLDIHLRSAETLRFVPALRNDLPPEALAFKAHREEWSERLSKRVAQLNSSRAFATPSALHRRPEEGEPVPANRRESRGADFGELVHRLFEIVDFKSPQDLHPAAEIAARELDLDGQAVKDAVARVEGALKLPFFAERVVNAQHIHREIPFCSPSGEALMEGRIDLLLVEPDGVVIADYKTDAVADEAAMMARAEFHRPQLEAYARALAGMGLHVKELVLIFLSLGRVLTLPYTA